MVLQIPEELQSVINDIKSTKIDFGEYKITPHPLINVPHERFLKVTKMLADTKIPRVYLEYFQVLRNENTGEIIPSNLPTPEWVIDENYTLAIRDQEGNKVKVPAKEKDEDEGFIMENGEPKLFPIELPANQYMSYIIKNRKSYLIDIIGSYLTDFIVEEGIQDKLDSLA